MCSLSRRLLAPLLVLCAVALVAASAPAPQDAELSLHDLMMGIKRDYKALSQSVADPDMTAKSLEALSGLQQYVMLAKTLEPSNLDEVARDERKAHKAAYRADLARMLVALTQAEIALLEERHDEAGALVKGLIELRNQGHEAYQSEDDHHDEPRGRR